MSSEATRTTLKNIRLGDTVNLQIMALTNHPCGQFSMDQYHPNYNHEFAVFTESVSSNKKEFTSVIKNSRYSACKPGPSLIVSYSNLVYRPIDIKVEKITGHSSILSWEIGKFM